MTTTATNRSTRRTRVAGRRSKLRRAAQLPSPRRLRPKPRENPMDPHRLARRYVKSNASDSNGHCCTLRHWKGEWWRWEDGRYRTIDEGELKVELNAAIKNIIDSRSLVNAQNTVFQ